MRADNTAQPILANLRFMKREHHNRKHPDGNSHPHLKADKFPDNHRFKNRRLQHLCFGKSRTSGKIAVIK